MTEGFVETNGVRLWFEERGDPRMEAVVFLAGATSTAMTWPNELLDPLAAAGRRVVRYDTRDIGLSTHVDFDAHPYGMGDMVVDLVGLLDHLCVDRAHLVGQSMGGIVAQLTAVAHRDRVRSLALLNTTPGPDDRLSPPVEGTFAMFEHEAHGEDEQLEQTVAFGRALAGPRFGFDDDFFRGMLMADNERGTNPDSHHGDMPFEAPSRLGDLATITAPTLVVHGTDDPLFPIDHAEMLTSAIPGAHLVRWDGVGHEIPRQLIGELATLLIAHTGTTARQDG